MTLHTFVYVEPFSSRISAEYALFNKTRLARANEFISDTLNRLGGMASLDGTHLKSGCVRLEEREGWALVISGQYEITS